METGGANRWRGLGRAMQAIALTRDEQLRSKPSCVEPPSERLVWQGRIWASTQMDFEHSVFCTLHHHFQCVTVSLRPRRAGLTSRGARPPTSPGHSIARFLFFWWRNYHMRSRPSSGPFLLRPDRRESGAHNRRVLRRVLDQNSCTTDPIALLASIRSGRRGGGAERTSSGGGEGPERGLQVPRAGRGGVYQVNWARFVGL